jgi:hypothetical protein
MIPALEALATSSRWLGKAAFYTGFTMLLIATLVNRLPAEGCDRPAWRGTLFQDYAPGFGISLQEQEVCQ